MNTRDFTERRKAANYVRKHFPTADAVEDHNRTDYYEFGKRVAYVVLYDIQPKQDIWRARATNN